MEHKHMKHAHDHPPSTQVDATADMERHARQRRCATQYWGDV